MKRAGAGGSSARVMIGVGFALIVLGGCHKPPPRGLAQVVQVVPADEDVSPADFKDGVRVSFDRPLAPPDALGRVVTGPAFQITPSLPGEARWMDARTLAFFPTDKPRPGQAYRIGLDGRLQIAGDVALGPWKGTRLVYDRIRIEQITLTGLRDFQVLRPVIKIRASQPISADVAAACAFIDQRSGGGGGRIIAVAVAAAASPAPAPSEPDPEGDGTAGVEQAAATARTVRVTPTQPLRPGTPYILRCGREFRPVGGGEGLGKDRDEAFTTYGPPGIKAIEPASGSEIPSDRVTLKIEFATPMKPDQVRKHLRLVTGGKPVPDVQVDGDYRQTIFRWWGDLAPRAAYTLEIAEGLVDQFGQALPPVKPHAFRTGDASARLSAATGPFVVERPGAQFPLMTRNLDRFDVRCAPVPEARLAAVVGTALAPEATWDRDKDDPKGNDKRQPLDWAQLGLKDRTSTVQPAGARNRWHAAEIDLGKTCADGKAAGVYLIELRTDQERSDDGKIRGRQRRALANVTDLGLLAKVGNASSLIWVVRLSTGKPVPGAAVKIRDLAGVTHFSGTTNADGVVLAPAAARLLAAPKAPARASDARAADDDGEDEGEGDGDPEGEGDGFDLRRARVLVTAHAGDDLAVLDTTWTHGLEAWNFDVESDRDGREPRIRGFIHSDRGLYRPGDTVHLRGLVRAIDHAGRMTVPRQRKVHLALEDPRGTTLSQTDLTISAFGGFHHDVVIDPDARLGDYQVKVTADGFVVRERFSVEEFRARTFEVAVKTPHRNVFLGRKLVFDVAANYLHGSPMRSGNVKWTVRRRAHRPHFAGFDDFVFQDFVAQADAGQWWARHEDRSFSDTVADGEVALNQEGKVRITTRDDLRDAPTAQDYLFEATIEDPSGQAVPGDQVVTGHRANLYLGLAPAEFVQKAAVAFPIKAVAFDAEGRRRAASARLTLTRRTYDCGRSGDAGAWRCQRKDDPSPAAVATVEIPAAGDPVATEVAVPASGEYLVRIEAPDGRGQQAVSSDFIYVVGKDSASWNDEDGDRMKLVASKTRYRPGDVARLVPQVQLPGALALVTLERDGVMSYAVKPLGEAIEVPIEARYAPNALCSVALVRGRGEPTEAGRPRFKLGMIDLQVDPTARRLAVTVATERPSYRPGELVTANVKVQGADGKPARAELAIAAADEGVLQILGFSTPDPLPAFYAPFGLGVDTATTWNRIVARPDPTKEGGEEGGDAGGSEAGRVRSRFMATAFWAPAVVTRPDGTASVSFTAPDNLTAFRLMAVAADAGDRFGSGDVRFTVRKPLQIVPALPRFFTTGDQAQAAALVHNDTEAPLDVKVVFTADGLEASGPGEATVNVPAGGVRRIAFAVRAKSEGDAKLGFRASGGGLEDAVAATVPVRAATVGESILLGEGHSAGQVTLPVPALSNVVPGTGVLDLVIDRTGVGALDEGLRYLVGYPYGCLEQITSKVVPMVALSDLARAGPVAGIKPDEIAGFVRAGIAKIVRHQSDGGGFGLWLGTPPEVHYTAYALWGLHVAAAAGFVVPTAVLKDGARYLKAQLGDRPASGKSAAQVAGEAGARAFAHAVLAELGKGDGGALAQMFELRAQLPIYGRAFLLMALGHAGRKDLAQQLAGELAALAPAGDGPVVLRETVRDLDWYWSSDVRTTALVLLALEQNAARHPVIARLGEGLLDSRRDGRWESTQENVYGLLAIAALARSRAAAGETTVRVSIAGHERASRQLSGRAIERLTFPLSELGAGPVRLDVAGAEVSYAARLRVERPLGADASDRGLAVRREYLDADSGAVLTRVKLGQAVRVRLTVTSPGRRAHVAVVDRLPAGLEPIITRFRPSLASNPDDDQPPRALWWGNWQTAWQNQELHDDRAYVFADALAPGDSRHEYLARATTAGTFAALAATAEAMYRPAINGRSAATTLVIEPGK
jgi:uncharacterized protein YfaS (alpha-2-macroglobulin family)